MWEGSVVLISIAAGRGAPMISVGEVRAVAGQGLEGDRFFGMKADRQVTLIESEAIEALEREDGVKLAHGDARRSIVTRGVPLNHLIDRRFRVGDVALRGLRLCEPCKHLAEMTDQKVLPGLVHRGGLRAEILNDGVIHVGDEIRPQ